MRNELSFSKRLDKILNESDHSTIWPYTPDDIYNYHDADADDDESEYKDDRKSFIYNPDGQILYASKPTETHYEIIEEYYGYYHYDYLNDRNGKKLNSIRIEIEKTALLGRSGTMEDDDGVNHHYVAFWNTDKRLYDQLLKPCLNQLLEDEVITPDTLLSIPNSGIVRVSDNIEISELDDEQLDKHALAKQLHLMPPEQKKAAMLKLGLSPFGNKHKWQKGSEKAGIVQPGQKWWATTSEGLYFQ